MKFLSFSLVLLFAGILTGTAQYDKKECACRKYFIGSTLLMLASIIPDNNLPQMIFLDRGDQFL